MLGQRALPDAGAECWTLLAMTGSRVSRPRERVAVMRRNKQTIESGRVRLAVRDAGGHGTPVVLVHGLGAIQRSWDRIAPLLAPHLRVVSYDQRGHGGSQAATDYSPDAFTADLEAVLDALALERPVLVGHSFGALLAVEVAAGRPGCAGVVAVDGGLPVPRPPEATDLHPRARGAQARADGQAREGPGGVDCRDHDGWRWLTNAVARQSRTDDVSSRQPPSHLVTGTGTPLRNRAAGPLVDYLKPVVL
jgi:pimeloyl-ACP methyl ester carboxylesterase